MRYGEQCSTDLSNMQTEKQAINHISRKRRRACEKLTSHTPQTEWGVIDMGRYFALSGDGAPLGMAVHQRTANTPETIFQTDEPTKNYAQFWSYNIRNLLQKQWKHTQRINTHNVSRSRSRHRRTEVRKAKKLHLDRGKQVKGVTNCSRHCMLSN